MEDRIARLEIDADRLRQEASELRAQLQLAQETERLRQENDVLRQAVIRYATAAAAVDLHMAMMRARHENRDDAVDNLRRATDEEQSAGATLRELAKQMQAAKVA